MKPLKRADFPFWFSIGISNHPETHPFAIPLIFKSNRNR